MVAASVHIAMIYVGLAVVSLPAHSQDFPTKPLRILSNEPGAGNDFVARLVAQGLAASFGQPVIVENRPGVISVETAAKAQPDGHSLLSVGQSMWIVPFMRENVPWDPFKSFAPITIMMGAPTVLVVNPSVPVKSVKELIALAKARPGEINYSAGTRGSAVHLAAELFMAMAGVKMVGIAYKGGTAATNAVIAGEVQVSFPTLTAASVHVKSGKLRALAVTSPQPSSLMSELPTVAASGVPGYELVNYSGMFVPARTLPPVVRVLNREIVRTLSQPEVKEKIAYTGAEVLATSSEQAAATIKRDMARLGKVIKDAGIRAD